MYMMTLTELGRGALNSYIHLKSSISFLFLRLPLAERDVLNPKIQQPDL